MIALYPGVCAAILLVLCAGVVSAASPESAAKVAEGNAAYAAGDYETALKAYEEAEVGCPECPELAYDRGLAYYRMRDFVKARELFNAALATRDLGLEARAKYNLGIVSYAQALEKLSAPQEAIEHARQAIYHYRDALDLDPEDADARGNIEIAQLLIKDLLDKLKQEQEEQEQKQDQQCEDQQNEDQQKQDQQDQEQQQDQQQQEGEQDEKQQEQDGQSDEDQQPRDESAQDQQSGEQQDEQQQQTEEQQAQGERREMTEEELESALQAVRDREAQRRAERARRKNAHRAPVTRDW